MKGGRGEVGGRKHSGREDARTTLLEGRLLEWLLVLLLLLALEVLLLEEVLLLLLLELLLRERLPRARHPRHPGREAKGRLSKGSVRLLRQGVLLVLRRVRRLKLRRRGVLLLLVLLLLLEYRLRRPCVTKHLRLDLLERQRSTSPLLRRLLVRVRLRPQLGLNLLQRPGASTGLLLLLLLSGLVLGEGGLKRGGGEEGIGIEGVPGRRAGGRVRGAGPA